MRQPTDKKAVRVNLDNETVDMLTKLADLTDSSKSRVVREAIRDAYSREFNNKHNK